MNTLRFIFTFKGVVRNIRRNLSDEIDHNGIIGTLSWVSQSIADWTVPNVRHPKPVDVALNYYGQDAPNYLGSLNHGHSRKPAVPAKRRKPYAGISTTLRPRNSANTHRKTIKVPRRPKPTSKRKTMLNKIKNSPSSYPLSYEKLFNKKASQKYDTIMPSESYSFPSSRREPSNYLKKKQKAPTITEYLLGKINNVFG